MRVEGHTRGGGKGLEVQPSKETLQDWKERQEASYVINGGGMLREASLDNSISWLMESKALEKSV